MTETPDYGSEFNRRVIDEFRANDGRVGGPFEGAPMVLVHHIGARSGMERINPLVYLPDGARMVVFASKGGAKDLALSVNAQVEPPSVAVSVAVDTLIAAGRQRHGDQQILRALARRERDEAEALRVL